MKCPRCDGERIRTMAKSPVGDEWEVYLCEVCNYSWRSTENIHILPKFKLNEGKIASLGVIPPIPPLRS